MDEHLNVKSRLSFVGFFLLATFGWQNLHVEILFATQNRNFPQDEENEALLDASLIDENSVFVQASRETLRPLIRAEKAIERKEYDRAVEFLGSILTQPDQNDYLVKVPGQYGSVTSLQLRAQDLLGQVPANSRRLFQVRYGVEAKQALELAVAERDLMKISSVMKRYFYTDAGYQAAMVAGYMQLELGRPVGAGQCFQRLIDAPDARAKYDPELSVLMATCWVLTDAPEQAQKVLVSMSRSRDRITFAQKEVPLFQEPNQALDWLYQLIGDSPLTQNERVREWLMFRGNTRRNAKSGSGFPMPTARWVVPTTTTREQELSLARHEKELLESDSSTIPVVQPIAFGNTVIIRMVDRIAAVHFESGKIEWTYPPDSSFFSSSQDSVRIKDELPNEKIFSQRMWRDHIFGQMSSDGRSLFVIPNPGNAGQNAYIGQVNRARLTDPLVSRSLVNELIALDARRGGALQWRVGGDTGLNEPKLAGAFFLGPPLPIDGQLLAVCQRKMLIQLVALEPATGKLLWEQTLASTEKTGNVSQNKNRRLSGVMPTCSNGLIICPTGVGALVALDMGTRAIAWGHQYAAARDRSSASIRPNFNSRMNRNLRATRDGIYDGAWKDGGVQITRGSVLISPTDRQKLFCFDLLTGKPRWRNNETSEIGIPRDDSLLVGTVHNANVILVGKKRIRAVAIETGESIWATKTNEYGNPSGYGYATESHYFAPTTKRKILKVNLETGKIEGVVQTSEIPGNLINFRNHVISHSATQVRLHWQSEVVRELIENDSKISTEDQFKKTQIQAELAWQSGDLQKALNYFESLQERTPTETTRNRICELLLEMLPNNYDFANQKLVKYWANDAPLDNLKLEQTRIRYLIRQNRIREALDQLMAMLDAVPSQAFQQPDATIRIFEDTLAPKWELGTLVSAEPDTLNKAINVNPKSNQAQTHQSFSCWFQTKIGELTGRLDQQLATKTIIDTYLSQATRLESAGLDRLDAQRQLTDLLCLSLFDRDRIQELATTAKSANRYDLVWSLEKNLESKENKSEKSSSAPDFPPQFEPYLSPGPSTTPDWIGTAVQIIPELQFDDPQDHLMNSLQRHKMEIRLPTSNSSTPSNDRESDKGWAKWKRLARHRFYFYPDLGSLEMVSPGGEPRVTWQVRPSRERGFRYPAEFLTGKLYVCGQLLIGHIGSEIFALDLNLCAKRKQGFRWGRQPNYLLDARYTNKWSTNLLGVRTQTHTQTGGKPESQTCQPSRHGFCFVELGRLYCVDPLTGELRWVTDDQWTNVQLSLADDTKLIVTDLSNKTVTLFDIRSGRRISQSPLTQLGSLLSLDGPRALFVQRAPETEDTESNTKNKTSRKRVNSSTKLVNVNKKAGKKSPRGVRVVWQNLTDQKIDWYQDYPYGTHGCLLDGENLFVVSPENVLKLLRFDSNKRTPTPIFEQKISIPDRRNTTVELKVEEFDSCFVVYFVRRHHSNSKFRTSLGVSLQYVHRTRGIYDADVIAINKLTGEPLWHRPADLRFFQIVEGVPKSSPLALYLRRCDIKGLPSAGQRKIQLLAIDLRNGQCAANCLMKYSLNRGVPYTFGQNQ